MLEADVTNVTNIVGMPHALGRHSNVLGMSYNIRGQLAYISVSKFWPRWGGALGLGKY